MRIAGLRIVIEAGLIWNCLGKKSCILAKADAVNKVQIRFDNKCFYVKPVEEANIAAMGLRTDKLGGCHISFGTCVSGDELEHKWVMAMRAAGWATMEWQQWTSTIISAGNNGMEDSTSMDAT